MINLLYTMLFYPAIWTMWVTNKLLNGIRWLIETPVKSIFRKNRYSKGL